MRPKLNTKFLVGFILVIAIMATLVIYTAIEAQQALQFAVGENSIFLAREMLKRIDQSIYRRLEELQLHARHLMLRRALIESNREFEKIPEVEAHISKMDEEWVSQPRHVITPFMRSLIGNHLSQTLREDFMEFYEQEYGYKVYLELFVTNKYGANVAQTNKTSDFRQYDEDWWQRAKKQGFYIGGVEYDESAASQGITLALRIDDAHGAFIGILKTIVDAQGLIREAEIATQKYQTSRIRIATRKGKLIYSSGAYHFFQDVSAAPYFKKIRARHGSFSMTEKARERLFAYAQSDGYRYFKGLGWILIMAHDVKEILAPVYTLKTNLILASLCIIFIVTCFAYFFSRSITKPIEALTHGVETIAMGNLDSKVAVQSQDEIGNLAATFNDMTAKIRSAEMERQEKEEELMRAAICLDAMADALMVMDTKMNLIRINQATVDLLGYTREDLMALDFFNTIIPAQEHKKYFEEMEIGMNTGKPRNFETLLRTKKGREVPVLFSGSISKGAPDEQLGFVGVARDITARKNAEEELARHRDHLEDMVVSRTVKLEETMAELKKSQAQLIEAEKIGALGTLTAGIAHELNNPMMGMLNFIQYCLKKMPEKGKLFEVLTDAEHETKRCIAIVNNLLTFSRIEKEGEEKYQKIKLASIFDRILRLLTYRIEKENVSIVKQIAENTPEIWIKPSNIQQVFLNLAGNALDALKESQKKEIRLDVRPRGEFVCVTVSDSGPGIDSEIFPKIFDPFFTTKSVGKGTGLGLSVSQSIVNSHGGEITCDSKVDNGSVFKILLPIERNLGIED